MALVNGHPYYVGCVIDGHTGWRGIAEVCEIATDLGWKPEGKRAHRTMRWALRQFRNWASMCVCASTSTNDMAYWYADEAERWLNDNTADGFVWHWSDGEFFLSPYCGDDDGCDDETCACHS